MTLVSTQVTLLLIQENYILILNIRLQISVYINETRVHVIASFSCKLQLSFPYTFWFFKYIVFSIKIHHVILSLFILLLPEPPPGQSARSRSAAFDYYHNNLHKGHKRLKQELLRHETSCSHQICASGFEFAAVHEATAVGSPSFTVVGKASTEISGISEREIYTRD